MWSDIPWSMGLQQCPPACSPACCNGTDKETLVRGFHCAPLWQYYVLERRTLICPIWRKEHFSNIFSPLELYNWSEAPPILPALPATSHPLIVSAASPNEGHLMHHLHWGDGSKGAHKTWVWVMVDESSSVFLKTENKNFLKSEKS